MSIWTEPDHIEWAELAKRTEPFVEKLTGREDLAVVVKPDVRPPADQKSDPIPGGVFFPSFARINLNPNLLFDSYLSDVKFVDPTSIYSQRAFPRYIGTTVHESGHAKHSPEFPAELAGNVLGWAKALEETRSEGKILQMFPQYVSYIKAIVKTIVSRGFISDPSIHDNGTGLIQRYNIANTALLVMAREDIGVFNAGELTNAEAVCRKTLGNKDYNALREIWLEAQELEDNQIDRLIELAEAIQKMIDPNDELTNANQYADLLPCGAYIQGGDTRVDPNQNNSSPAPSFTADFDQIMEDVQNASIEAEKEIRSQGTSAIPPKRNIQEENQAHRERIKQSVDNFNRNSASYGRGWANPNLNIIAPTAKDISRSRAMTEALRKAQYREVSKTFNNSELPPGRLIIREAMNRDAQIASGQAITATPWKQVRRREVDNPPITLAVASDISGSMSVYQREVSSFTWAVSIAVKQLMGSSGAVAWNGKSFPLFQPNRVDQSKLPYYSAAGGSDGCPEAIRTLDGLMNLSFGTGVRVLAVITDGELPSHALIQKEIDLLAQRGVIILWILTTRNGFQPKNATVALLKHPDEFGNIVGQKMIEALSRA
jgi:hypothetical protein